MNNCESEEILEAANIAISNLLPTKSRSLYDIAYNRLDEFWDCRACRTDELVNLTVDDIEDLKLPDVACYTDGCLRRSSATLLADAGVDITTIKRHAGWKSTTVAGDYVENSIENKTKIANRGFSSFYH
ncbi:hypothetical protein NQ317_003607 [Molorchus minor]|uniref:Tyr recombinase domain-containing protein n=1 Tax=Molorchus minor TaxID=1323400 RepID=A0ABQ9IXK8_9CUCU|nr:hypothetical protein NQ317_003607 [Molorchus minor]